MGNGTFDTTSLPPDFQGVGNYGNAFVKLQVGSNGALSVADYFTMSNTTSESNGDQDLGSGGIMLIPQFSLAVGAGKDRNIYVVDPKKYGQIQPERQFDISGNALGGRRRSLFQSGLVQRNAVLRGSGRYPARLFLREWEFLDDACIAIEPLVRFARSDAIYFSERDTERDSVGRRE